MGTHFLHLQAVLAGGLSSCSAETPGASSGKKWPSFGRLSAQGKSITDAAEIKDGPCEREV
jgi:hypothetical protein